jgi:hypothetical protein
VKQGCPLSPTLFGLYIDKLEEILLENGGTLDAPLLGTVPVPLLLYADDLALISYSKNGLQNSLLALEDFCAVKKLTVNLKKTKVVVFNDSRSCKVAGAQDQYRFSGNAVEVVDRYTYLGVVFEKGLKWSRTKSANLGAMKRALFSMVQRCQDLKITAPLLQCSLFDALVSPVISYGCEIWGTEFLDDSLFFQEAEIIHRAFLRRILNIRKNVPNEVLLAQFERLPLKFQWQNLIVRFFNRLVNMSECRLVKQAFLENLELANKGASCWSKAIQSWAVPRAGLDPIPTDYLSIHCESVLLDKVVLLVADRQVWPYLLDEETLWLVSHKAYCKWFRSESSKTQSHVQAFRCRPDGFFCDQLAPYLLHVESIPVRIDLARFVTGSHNLEIECGRWSRPPVPRENRKCRCCNLNVVEDECHFVFECSLYQHLRHEFEGLFTGAKLDLRTMIFSDRVHSFGQFLVKANKLREAHLQDLSVVPLL